MERRTLGRTGHQSSVAILGGAAFARATPEQTEKTLEEALFKGVNHLDVAAEHGEAEANLGPLLADEEIRARLFLAGRTAVRGGTEVRERLEASREALQVEAFDLYQLSGITDVGQLDGCAEAIEALLAAKESEVARWVGVTGYDLGTARAQLEACKRWDLDTVMLPLSPRLWNDAGYREDVQALLSHCRTYSVGVQVTDATSWRPWGDRAPAAETWCELHGDEATIKRDVDFVLSTPGVHCLVTPSDRALIAPFLSAANKPGFVTTSKRKQMIADAAKEPLVFPMPAAAAAEA